MPENKGAQCLENFHCPRWEELPALGLYMDQVLIVLEEALACFSPKGERAVTAAMVNNYVKHKLIPPPQKKKYDNRHLASLVVIGLLKNVLSMAEISALIADIEQEHGSAGAYNLFCEELEKALNGAFRSAGGFFPKMEQCTTPLSAMQAAIVAFCGKLLVQKYLEAKKK